jgi:hypothetical protein
MISSLLALDVLKARGRVCCNQKATTAERDGLCEGHDRKQTASQKHGVPPECRRHRRHLARLRRAAPTQAGIQGPKTVWCTASSRGGREHGVDIRDHARILHRQAPPSFCHSRRQPTDEVATSAERPCTAAEQRRESSQSRLVRAKVQAFRRGHNHLNARAASRPARGAVAVDQILTRARSERSDHNPFNAINGSILPARRAGR